MAEIIARVECLKHVYPDNTAVDLCGLAFTVERQQRVAILGENGSGKSTLLGHLLGLLAPVEGRVEVFGADPARDWRKIRQKIGVVLQDVEEQIIGPTVWDDVTFSVRQGGWPAGEVTRRGEEVLRWLGLEHLRHRVPQYLSGGEKRRVAVAGAIIHRPELLVLDEPFTGLDYHGRRELIALLQELNAEGMAYVVATHEVDLVPEIADYVYALERSGIARRGRPEEVVAEYLCGAEAGLRTSDAPMEETGPGDLLPGGTPVERERLERLWAGLTEHYRQTGRPGGPRHAMALARATVALGQEEDADLLTLLLAGLLHGLGRDELHRLLTEAGFPALTCERVAEATAALHRLTWPGGR